jgi:nitrate reductase molybdenum cofactor assembly chaperone NarJ/NarW
MQVLRLISKLLDYPTQPLYSSLEEASEWVTMADMPALARDCLNSFIAHHAQQDLLDWQSEYDGNFDRGRAVSLLIFEHIHGESRDRGQAMVNLLSQYHQAGLELAAHELPDYLPLYLEFVSTQGPNAVGWLQDIAHILALLQTRLEERYSDYSLLAKALIYFAKVEIDYSPIREQVAKEVPDNTPQALDKIWEEEEITFSDQDALQGCESGQYRPSAAQRKDLTMPVKVIDMQTPNTIHNSYSTTNPGKPLVTGERS